MDIDVIQLRIALDILTRYRNNNTRLYIEDDKINVTDIEVTLNEDRWMLESFGWRSIRVNGQDILRLEKQ